MSYSKGHSLLKSVFIPSDTTVRIAKEILESKYLRKKSSERLSTIRITFASTHIALATQRVSTLEGDLENFTQSGPTQDPVQAQGWLCSDFNLSQS